MWTTPPLVDQVLPYAPLRLHTIEMIPQCVWLMCFWLATMNERFITIYLKNNTTQQRKKQQHKNKTFICIVKTLFVWKQDQELLLNSKSACVGWTMSGTELKKNHFCAQRF